MEFESESWRGIMELHANKRTEDVCGGLDAPGPRVVLREGLCLAGREVQKVEEGPWVG